MDGSNKPGRPLPQALPPAVAVRDDGLRRLRHVSNWTLAAMVAGVGVSTALLEQLATRSVTGIPAAAPAATGATAAAGGVVSASAPTVGAPVATTTASGVVIPAPGATPVTGAAGRTVGARPTATGGDS